MSNKISNNNLVAQHLLLITVHIVVVIFLFFAVYMGSGAPIEFKPFEAWLSVMLFFSPFSFIGNWAILLTNRGKKNNLKSFFNALPILLIPYLLLLCAIFLL